MRSRLSLRVKTKLKVTSRISDEFKDNFGFANSDSFSIDVIDISTLGMGVYVDHFLPKGLIILLDIKGKPFGLKKDMSIKAEVRHCEYSKPFVYKCGVKFIDIPSTQIKSINKFIKKYDNREHQRLTLSQA